MSSYYGSRIVLRAREIQKSILPSYGNLITTSPHHNTISPHHLITTSQHHHITIEWLWQGDDGERNPVFSRANCLPASMWGTYFVRQVRRLCAGMCAYVLGRLKLIVKVNEMIACAVTLCLLIQAYSLHECFVQVLQCKLILESTLCKLCHTMQYWEVLRANFAKRSSTGKYFV